MWNRSVFWAKRGPLVGVVAFHLVAGGCQGNTVVDVDVDAATTPAWETTVIVDQVRDSSLSEVSPNRSFGLADYLVVGGIGRQRSLIQFDENSIRQAAAGGNLVSATVEFTIAESSQNWGENGSQLGLYALTKEWTEWGASWTCANDANSDPDISNCETAELWTVDGVSPPWDAEPVGTVTVVNGQTGTLKFDVSDTLPRLLSEDDSSYGWVLLRENQEASAEQIRALPDVREQQVAGTIPDNDIALFSGQSAHGPKLILVRQSENMLIRPVPVYQDSAYVTADNWVDEAASSTNYSANYRTSTSLLVSGAGGSRKHSIVWVDTRTIERILDGGRFAKAVLSFEVSPNTTSSEKGSFSVHPMSQDWSENSSSWSSAGLGGFFGWNMDTGLSGGSIFDFGTYGTAWLDTASVSKTGTLELDVTADVQRIVDGGSNYGWVLISVSSEVSLVSREGDRYSRPKLDIYVDCTGQSDTQLCVDNSATCGTFTGTDSCGTERTVECGDCNAPDSCGGGGVANSCGCTALSQRDDTCDGVDDNCNGILDEDYIVTATTCGGPGACQSEGSLTCLNAAEQDSCVGGTPASVDDTCDGLDDDCDGQSDEDFTDIVVSCGGLGVCGDTGTSVCISGSVVEIDSCDVGSPTSGDFVCNGFDDDCDGQVDEAFYQGGTSYCGVGACEARGLRYCTDGSLSDSCVPGTPLTTVDECDGIDNDCDGQTDEDYPTHVTSCGLGVCARPGVARCGGTSIYNDCPPVQPNITSYDGDCNGLDDDCDGKFDEHFLGSCLIDPLNLLDGPSGSLASAAVYEYNAGDVVNPSEIGTDVDGNEIQRTALTIAFAADATVAEVNTMLTSINGRIVDMMFGVDILQVRIPDPGTMALLDILVQQLEANPAIRRVSRGYLATTQALPDNGEQQADMGDQFAVRAPAAWNARKAIWASEHLSNPPTLIIGDFFSNAVPNPDVFDVSVSNPFDFFTLGIPGTRAEHGWHVLGIIAGKHAGPNSQPVTGMYPATLPIRVHNASWSPVQSTIDSALVRLIKGTNGNLVLNTSISTPFPYSLFVGDKLAMNWIEKVRGSEAFTIFGAAVPGQLSGSSLENKFIHVTSAGNFGVNSKYNAPYAGAASGELDIPYAPLRNTLIVENRELGPTGRAPCLASNSNWTDEYSDSPNISAIGAITGSQGIRSFITDGGAMGNKPGTSQAAPQVSGLAAYIWAVNPNLTISKVMAIIRFTAHQPWSEHTSCSRRPSPIIDAYAAILAADNQNFYIRRAILDVNDDNSFDEIDLAEYVNAFAGSSTGRDPSRYDLNGDGITGGEANTARFNLDAKSVQELLVTDAYTTLDHPCGGSAGLNEEAVTDEQILCYYAFSNLYKGEYAERDLLLEEIAPKWIVYSGIPTEEIGNTFPSHHIWIASPDGDEHIQLTTGLVYDADPVLSYDRKRVAFVRNGAIYTINIDGTGLTLVVANARTPVWDPQYDGNIWYSQNNQFHSVLSGYEATGSDLHWHPDRERYFYSRDGKLYTKRLRYLSSTKLAYIPGAIWSVSPDGKKAYAVVAEDQNPAPPLISTPSKLIWINIDARLANLPSSSAITEEETLSIANETLAGARGRLLAEHCHPLSGCTPPSTPNVSERWITGDTFDSIGVSPDNNLLVFRRIKAAINDHTFVEADIEEIRATGAGLELVHKAWERGDPGAGSDPVMYDRESLLENVRWDNSLVILGDCGDHICRVIPGLQATTILTESNLAVGEASIGR